MDKLRVGIIVRDDCLPTEGGRYSYHDTLLEGINKFNFSAGIEIINIVLYKNSVPTINLGKQSVFIRYGFGSRFIDISKKVQRRSLFSILPIHNPIVNFFYKLAINRKNKRIERKIKEYNVDLVYYLNPEPHVLNYPFITTHWDIAHKSVDAFPEFTLNNNHELREKYYMYTLNKAFVILCESESGAKELNKYYSFYEKKIKVLPMFGGNIIERNIAADLNNNTLTSYKLEKNKFFIYPAQFWPSKNHYNLILGFQKLLENTNNKDLKLCLCGSDMGNLTYIKKVIVSLSLQDRVLTPGFISSDDLYILYKNALALTMTTFLGPTNMPVIEAAHLGCPVLCSDFDGHREILENTALYFDPSNVDEICRSMHQVLDQDVRNAMSNSALRRIKESPFILNKSLKLLDEILLETKSKRKAWGSDYLL